MVGRACLRLVHQNLISTARVCLGLAMLGVVSDSLWSNSVDPHRTFSRKAFPSSLCYSNIWTYREPEVEVWVDLGDKFRGAGAGLSVLKSLHLFWPRGSDGKDCLLTLLAGV